MDPYIEKCLSEIPGHIGFYYRNLSTGETQAFQDQDCFEAASIIKLPILAAIFFLAEERPDLLSQPVLVRDGDKVPGCGALQHITGEQTYDVLSLCRLMITISDNTATNALIRLFGIDALNDVFRTIGLKQTRLNRLLFDAEAAALGKENLFQMRECCGLFEQMYAGSCVSPAASEQMLSILKQQQINHKISGQFPPGISVAHKTGEDIGITNDIGIVYAKNPFVIGFASNHTNVPAFEHAIRCISFHFLEERE